MTSIRGKLTLWLLAGILSLSAVLGTALYLQVRSTLVRNFDAALLDKTRALASLVRYRKGDRLDFEFSWDMVPEFLPSKRPEYFQLRSGKGVSLLRSRSLGEGELPGLEAAEALPGICGLQLPDGSEGRAAAFRFTPRFEEEEEEEESGENAVKAEVPRATGSMTLVVARDRTEVDKTLRVLLSSMLLTAGVLCVGLVLVVAFIVGRGLRPLGQVAGRAASIDAWSLEERFPLDDLPDELRPICGRLNDLLERLQASFQRERRFNGDVAHELRTPIAELRSLAEVALKYPEGNDAAGRWARDAFDIARHMETLVTALLSLARCQMGSQAIEVNPVDLVAVIEHAWRSLQAQAKSRQLNVSFEMPPEAPLSSDPAILHTMVSNLLANAVEHTPQGGDVVCRVSRSPGRIEWELLNTRGSLGVEDLPHVFEPFWRKDPSRSSSVEGNLGLGLALVDAYAKLLAVKIEARMAPPDRFSLTLEFPADLQGEPGPQEPARLEA